MEVDKILTKLSLKRGLFSSLHLKNMLLNNLNIYCGSKSSVVTPLKSSLFFEFSLDPEFVRPGYFLPGTSEYPESTCIIVFEFEILPTFTPAKHTLGEKKRLPLFSLEQKYSNKTEKRKRKKESDRDNIKSSFPPLHLSSVPNR